MLSRFNEALVSRYWAANVSAGEYSAVSQVQVYEGIRAMFEAYSRNKHNTSTGVIQVGVTIMVDTPYISP